MKLKIKIIFVTVTICSTFGFAHSTKFSDKFIGKYELIKSESTELIWKCSKHTSITLNKNQTALKLETTFGYDEKPGNDRNYTSIFNFENKCDVESQEVMNTSYFDACVKSTGNSWKVNRITSDSSEFKHNNYTQVKLAGFFNDTLVIAHGRNSELLHLRLFDEKPIICTYKKIN